MDYYKILGVDKNASEADIKKAYRTLAHKYHPDKKTGDEKKFKEVNEAYQVLGNKEKRAQFDRFGSAFNGAGGQGGFSGFEGFSAGGGPAGWDFSQFNNGDFGGFSDIFEQFFGGAQRGGGRRQPKGSDIKLGVEITLEEAFTGAEKEIEYKTFESCKKCDSLGYVKKEGLSKCERCEGRGRVKQTVRSILGTLQQVGPCPDCFGKGEKPNKLCEECNGAGRVATKRKEIISIPAGVENGQLLKLPHAGQAGERGDASGDLYVQILVKQSKDFERDGSDLITYKTVSSTDVLLGKEIDIETIGGKIVSVTLPKDIDFGQALRVSSYGMPSMRTGRRGDLFVRLNIRHPEKLSKKAKEALKILKEEI
ncbi:MAG: DnaJ C-terminal domain-containing protein [Candidatus Paceibacterota bacterium]